MAQYSKFIIALIGAVLMGMQTFFGLDLEAKGLTAENIWGFIVPILTALGVWGVSNNDTPKT